MFFAPTNKYFVLTGDESLRKRPMDRVIDPLTAMGARFAARDGNHLLPMTILPSVTKPIHMEATTKSAQVKSAVLLAGVQTEGITTYIEKSRHQKPYRDYALCSGCKGKDRRLKITVEGAADLRSMDIVVPGDFFICRFLSRCCINV